MPWTSKDHYTLVILVAGWHRACFSLRLISQAALLPFCSPLSAQAGRGNREVDTSYLGADFVETRGDGFCWCVTSKHVTFQNPCIFISRYISKVPVQKKFYQDVRKGSLLLARSLVVNVN